MSSEYEEKTSPLNMIANFSILTKIIITVAAVSVATVVVALVGIRSLSELNDITTRMDTLSNRALVAQRVNTQVVAMNRAEFRMALDPSEASRSEAMQTIDEAKQMVNSGLIDLSKEADEDDVVLISKVKSSYANTCRSFRRQSTPSAPCGISI